MNIDQIKDTLAALRQIVTNRALLSSPLHVVTVVSLRDNLAAISADISEIDSVMGHKLSAVKTQLFIATQNSQTYVNPVALGEAIFCLEYLEAKAQKNENDIWALIHPSIQKSSEKLYEDGHYANAAEDAFIEFNCRAKDLFQQLVPGATSVPDGCDLMHKLFGANPALCEVADTSTKSGSDYQQGFHFLAAGAMLALRNPKAHSNSESLSAEEAMRRLMFASMLMCKLDEITLDN